jgi:MFS family permease
VAYKTADKDFVAALRQGIGWAGVLFAVCFFAFSLTSNLWLSLVLMVPIGFAMSAIFAGSQAVLQVEVEDRVRGAFTAMFYNFSYFGMLALGGPILGHIADWFGLTAMVSIAGILTALGSTIYLVLEGRQKVSA